LESATKGSPEISVGELYAASVIKRSTVYQHQILRATDQTSVLQLIMNLCRQPTFIKKRGPTGTPRQNR
jgi:hypothetical protein